LSKLNLHCTALDRKGGKNNRKLGKDAKPHSVLASAASDMITNSGSADDLPA
jgi:hypothetical protein